MNKKPSGEEGMYALVKKYQSRSTKKIGFHFLLPKTEIKNDRSVYRGRKKGRLGLFSFFCQEAFLCALIEGFDVTETSATADVECRYLTVLKTVAVNLCETLDVYRVVWIGF